MTHNQILQRVWGSEYFGDVQLLRATMRSLRCKLGDDASEPRHIFTDPQSVPYGQGRDPSTGGLLPAGRR